jgi:nucleolar GTP-binding protein
MVLPNQFDSDDEREAQEAQVALSHKIKSQSIKKSKKNQARLPRTAGLRTLSELTSELTKAGLDPSRIQERAEMIAKLQGAKRKRDSDDDEDEDEEMGDAEEDGSEREDGGDGWMDVDEDESAPKKRVKTNSGRVINKREPRSHRQLVGMRDEAVSVHFDKGSHEANNSFSFFFLFFSAIRPCQQTTESWSTPT